MEKLEGKCKVFTTILRKALVLNAWYIRHILTTGNKARERSMKTKCVYKLWSKRHRQVHPALSGNHDFTAWQIQKTFKGLITLRKQNKTEIRYLPIRMPNSSPPSVFPNAGAAVAKSRRQSKGRKHPLPHWSLTQGSIRHGPDCDPSGRNGNEI